MLVKRIDTITQLKGYNKTNDIFALGGDYKKIIIFDYYGNILKIIHEGIKNSIYNLVHYRNNNLLIYTVNTNIETSQLKIYDLNRNDNTASELNQLHKFNTKILLMIPLKSFLGMDILLTSTNQEIKKEESENKNINQKILNSGKSLGPNSKEAF